MPPVLRPRTGQGVGYQITSTSSPDVGAAVHSEATPTVTVGETAEQLEMKSVGIDYEASCCCNPSHPPLKAASVFSSDYILLPVRRRGCVGIREIGTEHGPLDILLCACLGFPGLVYAMTATNERLWLRACVAVEFLMVGLASVLADGLLLKQSTDASNRDGLLFIDRKTSVVHVLTLLGMFIYRGVSGHASAAQLGIAVAIGVVSLATFHGRLYYTFVEQSWRPARICARLWHIGGAIAPLIAFVPRFL